MAPRPIHSDAVGDPGSYRVVQVGNPLDYDCYECLAIVGEPCNTGVGPRPSNDPHRSRREHVVRVIAHEPIPRLVYKDA